MPSLQTSLPPELANNAIREYSGNDVYGRLRLPGFILVGIL
uniref:Uncharacterized protein n=1 Tax=Fagus sylvatica TaxID=28930 RepID=A0A2N9EIS7_FAGSY